MTSPRDEKCTYNPPFINSHEQCNHTKNLSAEEVATELLGGCSRELVSFEDLVKALTEFRDEGIRECGVENYSLRSAILENLKVAHNEALELAAKVAENTGNECLNCLDKVAEEIRKLKK